MRFRPVVLVVLASSSLAPLAFAAPTGAPAAHAPAAVAKPAPAARAPERAPRAVTRPAARTPSLAPAPPRVGNSDVPAAVEFATKLAPAPGFAYPVEDVAALRAPARAIVDAFGRLRNYAEHRAGVLGAGREVKEHTVQEPPRTIEASLEESLAEHGHTVADVPQLLRNEARRPGLSDLTKSVLKNAADLWEHRTEDPRWTTLTELARRRAPRPAQAKAATPAEGDGTYARNLRMRAEDEWNRARDAIGWDRSLGYRELEVYPSEDGRPAELRAFTYERWMAYRVPLLREADEHRAYIETTFGNGRFFF